MADETDIELGRTPVRRFKPGSRGQERLQESLEARQVRGLRDDAAPSVETASAPIATALSDEDQRRAEAVKLEEAGDPPEPEGVVAGGSVPLTDDALQRARERFATVVERVYEPKERQALQRLPRLAEAVRTSETLEDAALLLLGELQPGEQDAVRQASEETGDPLWVIMMGAVRRAAQTLELLAGEFDPDWRNRDERRQRMAPRAQFCKTCNGELPGTMPKGATACCNAHGVGKVEHSEVMIQGKMEPCPLRTLQMIKGKWLDVGADG